MADNVELLKSGLLIKSEPLKQIRDHYLGTQSDGGDSDGNDSSDGND